jgi:hypothetical protein
VSATLPGFPCAIGESDGRTKLTAKIKAPFRLTTMNHPSKTLRIWVWSRRGKRWAVDQEICLDVAQKPSASDS